MTHDYQATVEWQRQGAAFVDNKYSRGPRTWVLRLSDGPLIKRFDMELGTVDDRETAILSLERKKQISTAKDHGFCTLCPAKLLSD